MHRCADSPHRGYGTAAWGALGSRTIHSRDAGAADARVRQWSARADDQQHFDTARDCPERQNEEPSVARSTVVIAVGKPHLVVRYHRDSILEACATYETRSI